MRLEATKRFVRRARRLSADMKRAVDRALYKLQEAPELAGLNLEVVKGTDGAVFSVRVNQGLRIIFRKIEDVAHLEYVGTHDEAYRFGEKWALMLAPASGGPDQDDSEVDMAFSLPTAGEAYNWVEDVRTEARESKISEDAAGTVLSLLNELISTDGEGLPRRPARGISAGTSSTGAGSSNINVIPSKTWTGCKEVLVAICDDSAKFRKRLQETLDYLIRCPTTRFVVILTSQWDAKAWKDRGPVLKHAQAKIIVLGRFAGRVVRMV